jgi:hypothetical protein
VPSNARVEPSAERLVTSRPGARTGLFGLFVR